MKIVMSLPFTMPCRRLVGFVTNSGSKFLRDTSGAVSAEFAIILPALLMIFVLIASASVLLVTASEVQQVSFELTRGSVRYYEPGIAASDLCNKVQDTLAPSVIKTGNFLSPERFTDISCAFDASDALTVSVTYDLRNLPIVILGGFIGLQISEFTRTSKMWL